MACISTLSLDRMHLRRCTGPRQVAEKRAPMRGAPGADVMRRTHLDSCTKNQTLRLTSTTTTCLDRSEPSICARERIVLQLFRPTSRRRLIFSFLSSRGFLELFDLGLCGTRGGPRPRMPPPGNLLVKTIPDRRLKY
jgi:hypothetical protein